jgi:type IV pilus assembly protein PilA
MGSRIIASVNFNHHQTMNTQIQNKPRKKLVTRVRAAFSLVELLVVIAVIGIIAAIAIPNIAGITGSATTSKDKRNAQNIASVYSSGKAAGATTTATAKDAIIAEIVTTGMTLPTGSSFTGAEFKVPGLSTADQTAAAAYLSDTLEYTPNATP